MGEYTLQANASSLEHRQMLAVRSTCTVPPPMAFLVLGEGVSSGACGGPDMLRARTSRRAGFAADAMSAKAAAGLEPAARLTAACCSVTACTTAPNYGPLKELPSKSPAVPLITTSKLCVGMGVAVGGHDSQQQLRKFMIAHSGMLAWLDGLCPDYTRHCKMYPRPLTWQQL